MRLTVKKIERLKEPGRYRDDAVRGLYLQLKQKKGTKRLPMYAGIEATFAICSRPVCAWRDSSWPTTRERLPTSF